MQPLVRFAVMPVLAACLTARSVSAQQAAFGQQPGWPNASAVGYDSAAGYAPAPPWAYSAPPAAPSDHYPFVEWYAQHDGWPAEPSELPDSRPHRSRHTWLWLDSRTRPHCGLYGGSEVLLHFRRGRPDETNVLVEDTVAIVSPPQVVNQLTTSDLYLDPRNIGLRAWVGVQLGPRVAVEGSYLDNELFAERSIGLSNPTNSLISNYLFNRLLAQTSNAFSYRSELHGAELGVRLRTDPDRWFRGSALLGFSYIKLAEDTKLSGIIDGIGETERTSTDVWNDLVGFQLGGELLASSNLGWTELTGGLGGKLGLFANFASQRINNYEDLTAIGGERTVYLAARDDAVVFATNLELRAELLFRLRNFAVRGGYAVMYLSGLALAPQQLLSTGPDIFSHAIDPARTGRAVNTGASALYHGPFIGGEITFPAGVR